jgi:hypothetical protein
MNKGVVVPLRVMFGEITRRTNKGCYIEVHGKPEPSVKCMHCGRKLTNEVSFYYGIGPVCGKDYFLPSITIDNYFDKVKEIRAALTAVKWKGFVPYSGVKITAEDIYTIEFVYKGKRYKVVTTDKTKIKEIEEHSLILSMSSVTPEKM